MKNTDLGMQFLCPGEEFTRQETSSYQILPVPYDGTSTYGKGADKGPQALIDASTNLELYDIETGIEAYTAGIHTLPAAPYFTTPEDMVDWVGPTVETIIDNGRFPVILGGEHSVSIGAIRGVAKKYQNLSVLQLDAHSDLRDSYEGSTYNHACVMARAKETVDRIVQVGIRSMDSSELGSMDKNSVFFAQHIYNTDQWMEQAISKLGERVYLTIDLDVFDPSIMPSTGTPEPGGLGWYQVIRFLKKLIFARKIVAFDIVELCPGQNPAPDFLAAKLLYKLISYREKSLSKE